MNEIPRPTWAPFVGAALAALTAGSLVVFSLVAQRTSLDGFPERRTAAPIEAAEETPASITIEPVEATGSTDDSDSAPASITPSLPLIEVADTTPMVVPDEVALADSAAGNGRERADRDDLDGRFRAEGVLVANRGGGGDSDGRGRGSTEAAGHDERHDGKHTHKSHDVKSKKNNGKSNGKKDGKKNKKSKGHGRAAGSSRSDAGHGRRGGRPPHAGRSHGNGDGPPPHAGRRQARGQGNSSHAGRSDEGSGSAKRSSGGSPPARSKAGGNGNSGGKGHKKH